MTDTPPLAVIDFLTHSKVRIAAPPAAIWPHIVDVDAWKSTQRLVHTGGEPGAVGERFNAVASEAKDVALFKVENAEMVARERRTIRLEGLDGDFLGFATWEITPAGKDTIVAYDVYCRGAMLPPGTTQAELMKMSQGMMDEGLLRLKALVEG